MQCDRCRDVDSHRGVALYGLVDTGQERRSPPSWPIIRSNAAFHCSVGYVHAPKRVVVADANASVRARIRNALDEVPDLRLVASARDATEAWRVTVELSPDVLVLGADLLSAEGRQLLERLRSDHPAVRIVMYGDDAAACAEGIRLGAAACVSKNESMQRLVAAIGVLTNIQSGARGAGDADR